MERLRTLRTTKLLTQEELARISGIGVTAISRLENGHEMPRFSTIKKLASALGIDPRDFTDAPPDGGRAAVPQPESLTPSVGEEER